jgi:hypothetical protein
MNRFRNLVLITAQLCLGVMLGLVALELTVHINPSLLLRGMALPVPLDPPITVNSYAVHSSEADLFYWHANLIRPISAVDDKVEAQVRYETDEFGFPNAAPLPATVDVLVLGRSYSMGAQATEPWPRLLSQFGNLSVLNLSQAGAGIDTKQAYLETFGFPHHPKWVIIEVLPSMDIIGLASAPQIFISGLPFPIVQTYARRALNLDSPPSEVSTVDSTNRIYPLTVSIPGGPASLVFYDFYLSSLTVDQAVLAKSQQWAGYTRQLLAINAQVQAHGGCVALLFAPTRENIYFALADNPAEFSPALYGWQGWQMDANGKLVTGAAPDLTQMHLNALAARDLVSSFASTNNVLFIDPSQAMLNAAGNGHLPFMEYDSHWSALGHQLVADAAAQALSQSACP